MSGIEVVRARNVSPESHVPLNGVPVEGPIVRWEHNRIARDELVRAALTAGF